MYIKKDIDTQINLQTRILNGISYKVIQKENIEEKTKILYYTELKKHYLVQMDYFVLK